MRLAYATTYDARDVRQYSGTGAQVARMLEAEGFDLDYVDVGGPSTVERVAGRALSMATRRRYFVDREPRIARRRARRLAAALAPDVDVVFSPGSLAAAAFDGPTPAVFWSDATFAGITNFYPEFSRLHPRTMRAANAVEQAALDRCSAAIYSSDWAAESALTHYGAEARKVHVVPYGANIDDLPTEADVAAFIAAREHSPCRLLFVGLDWERKGGDIAVETAKVLNESGIRTELLVIGASPPRPLPSFVRLLGFIDKSSDSRRLRECYGAAHLLILPTRAECAAVVFSEASAFGIPSITTDVGGISTVVKSGVNGRLLSLDASAEDYANAVEQTLEDYPRAAAAAFADYHARLSWRLGVARVGQILEEAAGNRRNATGDESLPRRIGDGVAAAAHDDGDA